MTPHDSLPLAEGSEGEAVADVQRRLEQLNLSTAPDPSGCFGAATRAAIEDFQRRRGLPIDGIVGSYTWSTLVEAGFSLGDRPLYRRVKMLRGDDVAELQRRLCALGFDTGRVDGIFGDLTAAAVTEFQDNAGLSTDGVVGDQTVLALLRLASRSLDPQLSSAGRDRERLRQASPNLAGRALCLGDLGGMATVVGALARRLQRHGASVTVLSDPDEAAQAQAANLAEAEVYLGLRLDPGASRCRTMFYRGYTYESPGGRMLAELIATQLPSELGGSRDAAGMALPILRFTQMSAVVVESGPAERIVEHSGLLADALASACEHFAVASTAPIAHA